MGVTYVGRTTGMNSTSGHCNTTRSHCRTKARVTSLGVRLVETINHNHAEGLFGVLPSILIE